MNVAGNKVNVADVKYFNNSVTVHNGEKVNDPSQSFLLFIGK